MTTATECHIRWMIRRDMPAVLGIENQCFEFAWTEEDFIRCLRQRNCIGLVALENNVVAGFVIYELHKSSIQIIDFAVHRDHQRQGVGSAMVDKLKAKLSERRHRLVLEVRETNLAAQLFFREQGFKCIATLQDFYDDSPEDAYLMEYRR